MNFRIIFPLLILMMMFSSCREDSIITQEMDVIPGEPAINIETEISGFVTDRNGAPLVDALVKVLNNDTRTNEFGYFEVTGLMNEKFGVIEVVKEGYFNQYETIKPSRTAKDRTRIQLTERILSGNVAASTGGVVSIGQNHSVDFQANGFIDEAGNEYTGNVNVFGFFIDPTDEDLDQIMPGNLMAINTEDELNVLQSFGMLNVELEGDNGEQININKTANVTFEVPAAIVNNAPAEIPLWYFEEATGLWMEEGAAFLNNGKYIGEVNHFTFWNCDVPGDATLLTGQIFDNEGFALLRVRITDLSTGVSFTDWTDSQGFFDGYVPQGVDLLLEVLSFCDVDNVVFSTNIGPYTEEEVNLGSYNISGQGSFSFFQGNLVDCDANPVLGGQVFFNLANQGISIAANIDANGKFSALIPTCDMDEIEVRGYNLVDGLVSQPLIILPSTDFNLGDLVLCTNISGNLGSVTIDLNGEIKTFDNCTVRHSVDNGNFNYLFRYDEIYAPGDTLAHLWAFTDLNQDLTNPDWNVTLMIYSPPPNGDDFLYTTYIPYYQDGVASATVDQIANNVGDLMELSLSGIRISKRVRNPGVPNPSETITNCTMTISAVLQ